MRTIESKQHHEGRRKSLRQNIVISQALKISECCFIYHLEIKNKKVASKVNLSYQDMVVNLNWQAGGREHWSEEADGNPEGDTEMYFLDRKIFSPENSKFLYSTDRVFSGKKNAIGDGQSWWEVEMDLVSDCKCFMIGVEVPLLVAKRMSKIFHTCGTE